MGDKMTERNILLSEVPCPMYLFFLDPIFTKRGKQIEYTLNLGYPFCNSAIEIGFVLGGFFCLFESRL